MRYSSKYAPYAVKIEEGKELVAFIRTYIKGTIVVSNAIASDITTTNIKAAEALFCYRRR